jgi:hypothetical protein
MRSLNLFLAAVLCGVPACAPDDEEVVDIPVGDAKSDSVTELTVKSGSTVTGAFTAPGGALDITVDCNPPADADTVGLQFTVTSAALGMSSASPARAAYWQWTGDVAAGARSVKLRGKSGTGDCIMRVKKISGDCTASSTFRSPITGHTHVTVGSTVSSWGSFPVSGNHWGAWAKWDTVYDQPIEHGFLIHNLEHGGIVLSYNCSAPTGACADAASELASLKEAFGKKRVIVTPDPAQPTRYAARAWRTGFQSECFDQERMLSFMNDFFRQGREDEDADPPIPFDPTTTDVPCQDIMSAPDSCP